MTEFTLTVKDGPSYPDKYKLGDWVWVRYCGTIELGMFISVDGNNRVSLVDPTTGEYYKSFTPTFLNSEANTFHLPDEVLEEFKSEEMKLEPIKKVKIEVIE